MKSFISRRTSYAVSVLLMLLSACASTPSRQANMDDPKAIPWNDTFFSYSPSLVTVQTDDLFRLPPDLKQAVIQAYNPGLSIQTRLKKTLTILFGEKKDLFPYVAGRSTIASETWKNKSGDCISVTLLTYSVSMAMHIPATMQEVRSPTLFDRHGNIDFVNDHVNLFIRNSHIIQLEEKALEPRNFVIDFEPEQTFAAEGLSLTKEAITARFYNNLAADYLAHNRFQEAYAYFKHAILTDPSYAKSYTNLAQLYIRNNLLSDAEKLLRASLAVAPNSEFATQALVELLSRQNRKQEAQQYAILLQQWQKQDPYYWLGLGINQLNHRSFDDAVTSLEKAQEMSHGFEEVHLNLALAYWYNKQPERAQEQLSLLDSLRPNNQRVSKLSKKFQQRPEAYLATISPKQ